MSIPEISKAGAAKTKNTQTKSTQVKMTQKIYTIGQKSDEIITIKKALNIWLPPGSHIDGYDKDYNPKKVTNQWNNDVCLALEIFSTAYNLIQPHPNQITIAHIKLFDKIFKDDHFLGHHPVSDDIKRLRNLTIIHGFDKETVMARWKNWRIEKIEKRIEIAGDILYDPNLNIMRRNIIAYQIPQSTLITMKELSKQYKFNAGKLIATVIDYAYDNAFLPEKILLTIIKASQKYKISPALIAAVIEAESKFMLDAESTEGAFGLMQVTKAAATAVNVEFGEKLFDIDKNISCGSAYLRFLLKKYKWNFKLAIAAYNAGPTKVSREFHKHKTYDKKYFDGQTVCFVSDVYKNYKKYAIIDDKIKQTDLSKNN